jgi:hypothetical protein
VAQLGLLAPDLGHLGPGVPVDQTFSPWASSRLKLRSLPFSSGRPLARI